MIVVDVTFLLPKGVIAFKWDGCAATPEKAVEKARWALSIAHKAIGTEDPGDALVAKVGETQAAFETDAFYERWLPSERWIADAVRHGRKPPPGTARKILQLLARARALEAALRGGASGDFCIGHFTPKGDAQGQYVAHVGIQVGMFSSAPARFAWRSANVERAIALARVIEQVDEAERWMAKDETIVSEKIPQEASATLRAIARLRYAQEMEEALDELATLLEGLGAGDLGRAIKAETQT